jgi:hypothetical protein
MILKAFWEGETDCWSRATLKSYFCIGWTRFEAFEVQNLGFKMDMVTSDTFKALRLSQCLLRLGDGSLIPWNHLLNRSESLGVGSSITLIDPRPSPPDKEVCRDYSDTKVFHGFRAAEASHSWVQQTTAS